MKTDVIIRRIRIGKGKKFTKTNTEKIFTENPKNGGSPPKDRIFITKSNLTGKLRVLRAICLIFFFLRELRDQIIKITVVKYTKK